jgi:hypothetical protein
MVETGGAIIIQCQKINVRKLIEMGRKMKVVLF